MSGTTCKLVATAIVRRGNEALFVRQRIDGGPQESWSLPGGVVEAGELLTEALSREVREETSMTSLEICGLAYVVQLHRQPREELWTVVGFEARCGEGVPRPADPDRLVTAARFMPVATTRSIMDGRLPRAMCEPLLSYLDGDVLPGAVWLYRESDAGATELVQVVAPTAVRKVGGAAG